MKNKKVLARKPIIVSLYAVQGLCKYNGLHLIYKNMATEIFDGLGRAFDDLFRRKLPVMLGSLAQGHFQDNFRLGGFVNGGLHEWKPVSRFATGAAGGYGPLLSGRNHLYSSIEYRASDYRVVIGNYVAYAPVHNWGAEIPRTDRMRRYAWHRFFKACGVSGNEQPGSRRAKTAPDAVASNPEAKFWKGMALSRKSTVTIPQRQFLGESKELTDAIQARIESEITKLLDN